MKSKSLPCPKCNQEMQEGFVLDRGDLEVRHPALWVQGTPQKSLWMGTKIEGRDSFPISSYRCTGCGYLESYASPAPIGS